MSDVSQPTCVRCGVLLEVDYEFWMSSQQRFGCFDCWLEDRNRRERKDRE